MSLGGFNVTGGALTVAFNPAGTQVAVGYASGQVGVFDAANGKKLQSYSFTNSPTVSGVTFIGRTGVLAIATQQGAYLWAPGNGSKPFQLLQSGKNTLSGGANAIAVDPDDPLKYAIATNDGTVLVQLRRSDLNIIRSQPLTQGQPAGTADEDAGFSPGGQQVVTADGDGKVRVYSATTGAAVMTLDAGEADATSAAFSPDGAYIAAGYSSGMTRVWDVATRLQLTQLAGTGALIETVRFSNDGSKVVTASDDGTVRVWYAKPRELRAQFASSFANGVPSPLLGAEYISANRIVALDDSGNLDVFTPDGTRLAGISPSHTAVASAAWDNAGTEIVTVGSDGTVRVWHAADADYTRMLPSSPAVQVTGVQDVAMSADGSRFTLVTSDNYYQVQVRSAQTGGLLKTLSAVNSIRTVSFNPNGRQIVAGDFNGQVEVWDAATGHRQMLGTPGPPISDIEFNNSGSEFVATSEDGTVSVWDALADKPLSSFQACPSPNAASPSPDGSRIVVACEDGSALVFDAGTGQLLTVLPATNTGTVSSAGFSPDGSNIITVVDAEGTGEVQVWNSELANPSISAIEHIAEERVTGQLTPAERTAYLEGIG
jgi:WD40 repeat protein